MAGRGKQRPKKMRRAIELEDLFRFLLVGSPDLSPDGSRCVVTVQRTDRDKNKYFCDLYMVEVASGTTTRLTSGDYSDTMPRWSPDGTRLAFVSTRAETAQVYILAMSGGEASKLTELPEGTIGDMLWSPDGQRLLITYLRRPREDTKKAAEERKQKGLSSPVRETESAFYRLDGVGYFGSERAQLYLVDANGGKLTRLTREKGHVGAAAWSPDGRVIAYVMVPDIERRPYDCRIVLRSVDGGKHRPLEAPIGPKNGLVWSPDGKWLAYTGYEAEEDPWGVYNSHVWVIDPSTPGSARDVMPDLDLTCEPYTLGDMPAAGAARDIAFTPDGAAVDVLVADRGATHVVRCPLDGGARRVIVGGHVHVYAKTPEVAGSMVCLIQTPTSPGEAYAVAADSPEPRKLTCLNDDLIGSLHLTNPEEIWTDCSATGRSIQGWVLKPPKFDERKRYPLVLEIHGGPHTQYGAAFFHEFHLLAAQGYVVLFTNPAGSQGRGQAYMQALRNAWGKADFPELMACVDAVVAQGYVDDARLAVTGGSYGGFMTNWVVGSTDRFAAAVTQRSVSNLVSMAGTTDFPMAPDGYFAGNAWSRPETLWELSPLRLVENVRTPLLILHSEGDLRCSIEQAEQLFAALRMLGRPARLVRFPREASHGLSRGGPPDLRARRLEEMTSWFAAHLATDGKPSRKRRKRKPGK